MASSGLYIELPFRNASLQHQPPYAHARATLTLTKTHTHSLSTRAKAREKIIGSRGEGWHNAIDVFVGIIANAKRKCREKVETTL